MCGKYSNGAAGGSAVPDLVRMGAEACAGPSTAPGRVGAATKYASGVPNGRRTHFAPFWQERFRAKSVPMIRIWMFGAARLTVFAALAVPAAFSQEAGGVSPPPYRGVSTYIAGVFVTPVPNVPMSGTVELESTQVLPDGSTDVKKAYAHIARDSRGRIYNERRSFAPTTYTGTTPILSYHIYDPETRMSVFLDPATHIARQTTLPTPEADPNANAGRETRANNPLLQEEDLGDQTVENYAVHGIRKTRTIPAKANGTGKAIVVVDEYWYSEELHLNMIVKHNDPRTGQQVVTITQVERADPDPSIFEVPSGYKLVDETPERR